MASPPLTSHKMLAALYACLGQEENAQKALGVYLSEYADASIAEEYERFAPRWTAKGAAERWNEDMRFAGMAE